MLQNILFPEGIVFDKKLDTFRTHNVNVVLELIAELSGNCNKKETGQLDEKSNQSRSVEREGFEPPDPAKDQRFSRPPHSTALPSL